MRDYCMIAWFTKQALTFMPDRISSLLSLKSLNASRAARRCGPSSMASPMGSSWISCTGGCLQWAHVLDTVSHCFWQCSCTYFRQQAKYRVRLLVKEFIVRIYKQKKHLASNSFSSGANPRNRLLNRRLSISSNYLLSFTESVWTMRGRFNIIVCLRFKNASRLLVLKSNVWLDAGWNNVSRCDLEKISDRTLKKLKIPRSDWTQAEIKFHDATLKKNRIEIYKNTARWLVPRSTIWLDETWTRIS